MRKAIFSICLLLPLLLFAFEKKVQDKGEVKGVIGLIDGDCFPGPNNPPCKSKPISGTLIITEPRQEYDQSKVIDSLVIADDGKYRLFVKAGKYSLFIRYDNEIYCSGFICEPDCYCSLVTIYADSSIIANLNINQGNW